MHGTGVAALSNIFAPDVFAIGGQIAKVGDPLFDSIKRTARSLAAPSLYSDVKYLGIAEQIDDAGMLGAAALAWEKVKWNLLPK